MTTKLDRETLERVYIDGIIAAHAAGEPVPLISSNSPAAIVTVARHVVAHCVAVLRSGKSIVATKPEWPADVLEAAAQALEKEMP